MPPHLPSFSPLSGAALLALALLTTSCGAVRRETPLPAAATQETGAVPVVQGMLNAGFVAVDGVYNAELMAPYDVLQHTVFRDSLNYIRTSSPAGSHNFAHSYP